jgi:hypothetical protein
MEDASTNRLVENAPNSLVNKSKGQIAMQPDIHKNCKVALSCMHTRYNGWNISTRVLWKELSRWLSSEIMSRKNWELWEMLDLLGGLKAFICNVSTT